MANKPVCLEQDDGKSEEEIANKQLQEERQHTIRSLKLHAIERIGLASDDEEMLLPTEDSVINDIGGPRSHRPIPPNGCRIQDDDVNDTLILLMNDDGSLSVDPRQLNNLYGVVDPDYPESCTKDTLYDGKGMPATLVRISSDSAKGKVNLIVGSGCDQTANTITPTQECKDTNKNNDKRVDDILHIERKKRKPDEDHDTETTETRVPSSTLEGSDHHNVFIGMDREQLIRLEKLLKSDEAKQILGDNVTAMLNMLSSEEDVVATPVANTILDAVQMDHSYATVNTEDQKAASPNVVEALPKSASVISPPTSLPPPIPKPRGVGRPRKVVPAPAPGPAPAPAAEQPRPQPVSAAHPGATLVPVITPLRIGASEEPQTQEGSDPVVVKTSSSDVLDDISHQVSPSEVTRVSRKRVLQSVLKKEVMSKEPVPSKLSKDPKVVKKTKKSEVLSDKADNGQLLNEAMAAALAAMEPPLKTSKLDMPDTVLQKEGTPKTYSRAGRQKVHNVLEKVDTPEVKDGAACYIGVIGDNTIKIDTTDIITTYPVSKKHYPKRENRKPPAHLADAFGPALFSTPDIIRRVGLEVKLLDDKKTVNDESSVAEELNTSNTLPSTTINLDSVRKTDVHARTESQSPTLLQNMQGSGPAVIVLMEEAISPSKSTALALSNRESIVGVGDTDKLLRDGSGIIDNYREEVLNRPIRPVKLNDSDKTLELKKKLSFDKICEPSVTTSEPSTSSPDSQLPNIPKVFKRKRRSAARTKKKHHVSNLEQTTADNTPKKQKQDDSETTLLESEEEIDVGSDISWNSEDDPDRLWCICKKPHNNRFMICCDSCNFWFHGKCVGITKAMGTQMEMKGEDWTCPSCVTKQKELSKKEVKIKRKRSSMSWTSDENDSTNGSSHSPTVPEKLKHSKSKTRSLPAESVQSHQIEGCKPTGGAMSCVVCGKNEARLNSIFCSDNCILTHAQESGQPTTSIKNVHPPSGKEVGLKVSGEKPTGLKVAPHKGISPKTGAQKGSPIKLIIAKIPDSKAELSKSVSSKLDLAGKVEKAALKSSNPTKISKLKKKTGDVNSSASLNTSSNADATPQASSEKAAMKAIKESSDLSTHKGGHFLETGGLTSSSPTKLDTPSKVPKATVKISSSPSKQSLTSPKLAKMPPVKVADASTKSKSAMPVPSSSNVKDKLPAKKIDTKRQSSTEVPKKEEEKPVGPEPIRINVRKTLHELLQSRIQECEDLKTIQDEKVKKIALKIEEELFALFKDTGMRYKSKYRSLVFNIKDPKNLTLFRKIVEKSVTPYQLVRLTPEELASQELADWRERESKHQLDMIKKNELDLMSLSKTYLMKTHKGEQIIENEGMIPAATVAEMEDCLDCKDDTSKETVTLSNTQGLILKSASSDSSKGKLRKHKSRRDKNRAHKKDKTKHTKSRHRDKHHESSSSKFEKNEKKKHKEKEVKEENSTQHVDGKSFPEVLVADEKRKGELVQEHLIESVEPSQSTIARSSTPEKKRKLSFVETVVADIDADLEPTSTVTIHTPDTSSTDPSVCLTVWKGFISMLDVSKFFSTMQIVHGDPEDIFKNLPDHMNVVGRISPNTVWDYISKMKKSGTKDILIVRFTSANEEEHIPYIALYSYLSGRNRLGVLGKMSRRIKDFYILPLSKHNPVPQVLLPLDGPGFEDNRPHLLIGIVVRCRQKQLAASSGYKIRMPRKYNSSPVDHSSSPPERSYTPPLRGVGMTDTPPLPATSLEYESTPPSSPFGGLVSRIDLKIKETSLSISTLSKKIGKDSLQDDGDEPYSPGESEDDTLPIDLLGNPTTHQDLQRTMDELNRKIAEQKQQIESITSAIGVPSASVKEPLEMVECTNKEGKAETNDGDEAYSPSSSFTPPRAATPIEKEAVTTENVLLPDRIRTLLEDLKKDERDNSFNPLIQDLTMKLEESIIRGKALVPMQNRQKITDQLIPPKVSPPGDISPTSPWAMTSTSSSLSVSNSPTLSRDTHQSTTLATAMSTHDKVQSDDIMLTSPKTSQLETSNSDQMSITQNLSKSNVPLSLSSSGHSLQGSISDSASTHSVVKTSQTSQRTTDFQMSQNEGSSSSPDSSGVFQTIPLMLGAISPSALLPKSDKTSRTAREDFAKQVTSRTKYPARAQLAKSSRDMDTEDSSPMCSPIRSSYGEEEPPPPGVDTPPRPLAPPRTKSPSRPQWLAESAPPVLPQNMDSVQQEYAYTSAGYQQVGYPIPTIAPVPTAKPLREMYSLRDPCYEPGYATHMPMGNVVHHASTSLQMGYNPPYEEMHYPRSRDQYAGNSGLVENLSIEEHISQVHFNVENALLKYKEKKRGRPEDHGHRESRDHRRRRDSRDRRDGRTSRASHESQESHNSHDSFDKGYSKGRQTKEKSHKRDTRESKSHHERSSHHKKSRNKSRSRD